MWQKFLNWLIDENNPSLPKSEYLYGTRHLIVIGIVIALTILVFLIFKNKSQKTKKIFFVVSASLFLFFEIAFRVREILTETNLDTVRFFKILLPLHFCSVAVWFIMISILSNNKFMLNIAPILGILATGIYLGYPAVGLNKTFINFPQFYSIGSHSFGFVVSFSMITLKYSKFDIKKIWQPYLIFSLIIAYGALMNFVVFPGSDYMYMINDPIGLNIGIPYQLVFLAIVIFYTFIFFLPNLIRVIINRQKTRKHK